VSLESFNQSNRLATQVHERSDGVLQGTGFDQTQLRDLVADVARRGPLP
jgi:hypothetical protein